MWYVYILKCADNTFYTGIARDLKERVKEHNFSKLGAKYTRGRRPVELIYSFRVRGRSKALKEEYRIKKLSRALKEELVSKE